MSRLLLGFFVAMHGIIHLGYITPAPADPNYPFTLGRSWLTTSLGLAPAAVRTFGVVLAALTVAAYVFAGLSAAGFVVPQDWWPALTVSASVASLLLLVCFWHPWLFLGVTIDLALLAALLVFKWQPFPAA